VSINDPERSFHIFYQLCAGATPEVGPFLDGSHVLYTLA
jgi:myosin heavy subunit